MSDDPFDPQREPPQAHENEPAAKSTGSNVLTVALIIFAGMGLTVCCACGVSAYFLMPEVSQDPVAARQAVDEMIDIELPPTFEPSGTVKFDMFTLASFRGAFFTRQNESGYLALFEFSGRLADDPQFRMQMRQSLNQQGQANDAELDVTEKETREIEVGDETVEVTFSRAVDRTTGDEYRLVDGILEGKRGPVMFMMQIAEEQWNEEEVVGILKSTN